MIEYKPSVANILLTILSGAFFFLILILGGSFDNIVYTIILIIVGYFLVVLFSKQRITSFKIDLDKRKIKVKYRKYWFIKKEESYLIRMLNFSYKDETGPRGIRRKEFRLFDKKSNAQILSIAADFDGWSENNLEKIVNCLNELRN